MGGVLGVISLVLLSWGASAWRYWSSVAEVRREISQGRFADARLRLRGLVTWWPEPSEVVWLRGVCAKETGHIDEAITAWARIPAGSSLAAEATLRRGEAEIDRGRLDVAELLFTAALKESGPRIVEIRHDLMQLFWQEGRLDEARALIERNWDEYRRTLGPASDPAIANLRAHLALDLEVYAVGGVQALLDRAGTAAPDSQRVWLGRANLAVRTGKFVEARQWLDRCLAARPDAAVAWTTALDLAMATDDIGLAESAVGHLTTAHLPPERIVRIRTWFAARRGDAELERTILEDRLAHNPGDPVAIERLSELEIRAGRIAHAAELRHRKTELDRARQLYSTRVASDFQADARELAGLAETLGRWFEARAFLAIVVERHPRDAAARARLEREWLDLSTGPSPVPLARLIGTQPALPTTGPNNGRAETLDFRDDAEASGLVFTFLNGGSPSRQLPETMGGGVALLDYDGDGWLDVYAVQGGTFPPRPPCSLRRPAVPQPTRWPFRGRHRAVGPNRDARRLWSRGGRRRCGQRRPP